MEWKDIKKELPEKNVGVLITDGKIITAVRLVESFKSGDLEWMGHEYSGFNWEFDFNEVNITHWMPLPNLPKKEGGEGNETEKEGR